MGKLSNRTLTSCLVPERQYKTELDPQTGISTRQRFNDDDQISLSFAELMGIVEKAREIGTIEGKGQLTREHLREQLKPFLAPGETEKNTSST